MVGSERATRATTTATARLYCISCQLNTVAEQGETVPFPGKSSCCQGTRAVACRRIHIVASCPACIWILACLSSRARLAAITEVINRRRSAGDDDQEQ